MLPDRRIGTSSPSETASVNASSTCVRERDRDVQAERDRVRERQLDLRARAERPQDPEVRDQAAARPDQRHRLLRREVPLLVEGTIDRQLVARPEELVEVLTRDVHVPGRGVDGQGRLTGAGPGGQPLHDEPPDQALDDAPVDRRRRGH
jgi:hypothetical protein